MPDEPAAPSADPEEPQDDQPEDDDSPATESESPEESETEGEGKKASAKAVPYSRFQQVNAKYRDALNALQWYQQTIGDPNAVLEFLKNKKGKPETKPQPTSKKPVTPEEREAIRALIEESYPELVQKLKADEEDRRSSEEAMFDHAESDVRRLAKELGYPEDEESVATLGEMAFHRIRNDEKLLRRWRAGDVSCVEDAVNMTHKHLSKLTKRNGSSHRDISNLPTAPRGGSPALTTAPKRKPGDTGLTKSAHDEAWALLQASLKE